MNEAIIYARFSKADQIKGHSIERQLDNAKLVCAARGLSVSPKLTFIEKGKSAFTGANRAKGSLLANLELEIAAGAHHGRTLVVEHLDRISRQGHDEVRDFLRTCTDAGVTVATFDGSRIYPAGQRVQMLEVIEIIMKAELAREESEKKSMRVRKSFAEKRQRAATTGAKAIASRPPSWIRRLDDGSGFELIEDRAEMVREAHRLAQTGYGTAQIARIFNDRNYPTWRDGSNGWHESYVGRMLTMRTAIGEYTSTTHGDRILDYYPAVITVEEYNRTQAARAKRAVPSARGRRGKAQSNLFQGFARCSHCGGPMGMKPSHDGRSYLKCANRVRRVTDATGKRLCVNGKGVRYERLETAVLDKIMTIVMDNDRFNVAEISETRIKLAEAARQIEHQREALANIKANLKLMVSATLVEMLAETEAKIVELTDEHEALNRALTREKGSRPSATFLARIKETRVAMSDPDLDTRRDARTLVHDSLKEVVTDLLCDDQGNSLVVVAHGLAAFRVTDAGAIDWQHDASGDSKAVLSLTSEAFADNKGTVEAVLSRARRSSELEAA